MTELVAFCLGVIAGLTGAQYLPAKIVNNNDTDVKIKKSVVDDSQIELFPTPKKKGLLKRIFKRKKE